MYIIKSNSKNITAAMEDYLETILALQEKNIVARVSDIAKELDVKNSSVNSAIKGLKEKRLVDQEKYGYIRLTDEGEDIARYVQKKHDILYRFLTEILMIKPSVAKEEACSIEHAISLETFNRLTKFFKFIELGENSDRPKIIRLFEEYLNTGKRRKCNCE